MTETVFELSSAGRQGIDWPDADISSVCVDEVLGSENLRSDLPMPELSQIDVIRHYIRLSSRNYGVDTGFYPLGSCTMKYNPKIDEEIASLPGFSCLHPLQSENMSQGILRILYEMQMFLAEIGGMDYVTLQPAAGTHGELTSLMIFKRHHERLGEGYRKIVIVPDSSHGTNPATAATCGYEILKVTSGPDGLIDPSTLERSLNDQVAAVMLTNPNTLGLFEKRVQDLAGLIHNAGALFYCDGANMNAVLGITRPGDAGFDAMHFNLHKTFSSPHGGGGPGSGPVGVKAFLKEYLPAPTVKFTGERYVLDYGNAHSIGRVHTFYGNIGVILRAYMYIRSLGSKGLNEVSRNAVLNANFLASLISDAYEIPYGSRCMHEFAASGNRQRSRGVKALDIAKRLIDFGFHPPTMYFPLIVPEALMIEPTETESIETLRMFAEALKAIDQETISNLDIVTSAPHSTVVSRLDETMAARKPVLRWSPPAKTETDGFD